MASRGLRYRLSNWLPCGKSRQRPPDAHIISKQGKLHETDGTPNQDAAFALLQGIENATTTTYTKPATAGTRAPRPHQTATTLVLAGVFDGHGREGHTVSKLAANAMETLLARLADDGEMQLPAVLTAAFQHVDAAVLSDPSGQWSGTTASVVIAHDGEVHMGWVGDSVIVVIADSDGEQPAHVRFVSSMHRPSDKEEASRVQEAGGTIVDGYVVDENAKNGIAVTRTIGDVDMHQYGCISMPQHSSLALQQEDAVIVLASDGLWDSAGLTAETVVRIASRKRGRCAKRICQQLMDAVVAADGPSDDCTIVCLTLQ